MKELKFGDVVKVKPIDIDEFEVGNYPIVKSYSSRYDKGSVTDKDGYYWIDVPNFGYCPIELSQIITE